MCKIHILPQTVVNKIAAGEVVERPSSVVKELVENSLDAQSKYISIELEDAGKKSICITDDGCGMSKNDARLAVERHATSKISDFTDLSKIRTLGFRGEALPSIAGVSRFRLVTKEKNSPAELPGWELIIEGGKIFSSKEHAHPAGTIIEVNDLFFNIPARKKFLKSSTVEQSHLIRAIEETALSHPDTGFSVKIDKKDLFVSPPSPDINNRIIDLLGNKLFGNLLHIEEEYRYIKINAFISRLENAHPNKSIQYFFVNRRPVINRLLSQALYDACKDSLPIGRHPMAIIMIEINPEYIDINVHPTKKLVKFSEEHEIYEALKQTVRKCITTQTSPSLSVNEIKTATPENSMLNSENSKQTILSFSGQSLPSKVSDFPRVSEKSVPYKAATQETNLFSEFHVLGNLHNTYILIETSEGLIIMDMHAANERILFEKFTQQSSGQKTASVQKLLIPFTLELVPHEFSILKNNIGEINELGFEIAEFGHNTFILKAVPAIFGAIKQLNNFFREFIALLIDDFSDRSSLSLKPREKIIRASCRAAVKARDKISLRETEKIIEDLKNCAQPLCCPHGRPTMINITINELEKKFLRRI